MYKKVLFALMLLGLAGLALAEADRAATGGVASPPDSSPPGGPQMPATKALTAQQFVNDAAVGGMKEIRLSQTALGESQDPAVQTFATRMVTDHTLANRKLQQIAGQDGLAYPATNTFAEDDPNWRNPLVKNPAALKGEGAYLLMTNGPDLADYETIQHLQSMSGREFDLAYARDMVNDHITAVNEFEAASRNLSDPALRKFATDTLPILREHSQMALKLEDQLAGQTAAAGQPLPGTPLTVLAGQNVGP